ncbi:MAG TPA: chromosome segregation protein SMC [Vicinamibacterales bacterium]|nr:chromosome segregation protein SMC [Vicinamibacterales bacterium]
MRLQRLEISGFKSFPDRAELAFDDGVTAIVGPNGCGKSNVVDAITWVLGEQSAKSLRGDRMEDVIFSGSDARKPTAAAEVRLRLARVAATTPGSAKAAARAAIAAREGNGNGHGDGHEVVAAAETPPIPPEFDIDPPVFVRDVEIGRRLYRSGESEYLIDGEVCRLRDIHDLLMDAGVGVKAYAVIEQGKIGQILTGKPTDRRQLIEEAAGVTKFKSRRRAAELKLEAAQQNLTRVEDIIFEVEKQRAALKRQAAKARRYTRLRDELRRWEKVQFATRYRALGAAIDAARAKLADAREREAAASARLAEVEATLERIRIELAEADGRATSAREAAHARELQIGRLQQQATFERQQVEGLTASIAGLGVELASLESRREPARLELEQRREAAARAAADRDAATAALEQEEAAYAASYREIEGLESDVEAARSEVFSAMNAATALRHAVENAAAARARAVELLARLEVEATDLRVEAGRAARARGEADQALAEGRAALEDNQVSRAARESESASARGERERIAAELRARENELAGREARLRSLEEIDAAHAEYGDAARLVLSGTSGAVPHRGAVADHLEVERGYERAVEACLGDLLQHVVVETHADARTGLALVRDQNAGRCGFVVAEPGADGGEGERPAPEPPAGARSLWAFVRVHGGEARAIRAAVGEAWLAESLDAAVEISRLVSEPVATAAGEVARYGFVLEGGTKAEARGILATKAEIKDLLLTLDRDRSDLERIEESLASVDIRIAEGDTAIAALVAEQHRQEKALVGFELQRQQAVEEAARVARKQEQVDVDRRRAEEERDSLDARQAEARESIVRLEGEQRVADERLSAAQRRLFDAREALERQSRHVAETKAAHAALFERAGAIDADVRRLEDAGRELEERISSRADERRRDEERRVELEASIVEAGRQLDLSLKTFDQLKDDVRAADDRSNALRTEHDAADAQIRDARRALDVVREEAGRFEVARATAEADIAHLAEICSETVQVTLEEVAAEVSRLEASGEIASVTLAEDVPSEEEREDAAAPAEDQPALAGLPTEIAAPSESAAVAAPAPKELTVEQAIAQLKVKIERLGPVNILAIDQFDELENRHGFLTAQRKDLVDSINATNEAIRRIEKTTRERFQEAFQAINRYFEETFTTMFGGGRAGLVLLDEADQLESGLDIIAQPPGKRLQSVQLLSGGEKALTAMALMFAIFRYRPSPFCLLDEIDAPLDDANIGRFVEMLKGMQSLTQFILITHNRKTMEIANRLYGVTMEEPGVSKLISLQLN